MLPGPKAMPIKRRLLDSCHRDPVSGCWLWTKHIPKDGYEESKLGVESIKLRTPNAPMLFLTNFFEDPSLAEWNSITFAECDIALILTI